MNTQIIDEIFNNLGKKFNAQRIFININDSSVQNFFFYNFSDVLSSEIKDYDKKALFTIYNSSCFKAVKEGSHYIPDISDFVAANNLQGSNIDKYLKKNNVQALVLLSVVFEKQDCGFVAVTFDSKNVLKPEDLVCIETISIQMGLLIRNESFYEKEKQRVKNISIAREIVDEIRNSNDVPKIKESLVNSIAKLYNADLVFFAEYNFAREEYCVSQEAQYCSTDNIKSCVGIETKKIEGFAEHIRDIHLTGKDIIFDDIDKYLDENDLRGTGVEKFYNECLIKSSASINVYYEDEFLGNMMLAFTRKVHISEDDITFIKDILKQTGIAIHQAKLYAKEKKYAQREVVLRKISELISSANDSKSVKTKLLSFICDYLEANRCFILDYSQESKGFLPVQYEHLSSEDEKSLIGVDVQRESDDEKSKLYDLIKNHDWLEKINHKKSPNFVSKTPQDIAFELRGSNLFELAKIFTEADLKAVKRTNEFFDKFSDAFYTKSVEIEALIKDLQETQPFLPGTKFPKASEIKNGKGVYRTDNNVPVIKLNEVTDFEEIGFPKGTTIDNLKFLVHGLSDGVQLGIFDSFSLTDSDALLSTSYIIKPKNEYRVFRPQGVIVDTNTSDIHVGSNMDYGSGCNKDMDVLKHDYLFGGRRGNDRTFFSDLLKVAYGLSPEQKADLKSEFKNNPRGSKELLKEKAETISDDEYAALILKYRDKTFQQIQLENPELAKELIDIFDIIENCNRQYGRKYNEVLISRPKIQGVFFYDINVNSNIGDPIKYIEKQSSVDGENGKNVSVDLMNFAKEENLPVIVFGD